MKALRYSIVILVAVLVAAWLYWAGVPLGLSYLHRSMVKIQQRREAEKIETHNRPIEFYGKVVDQDGKPVPDARVTGWYSAYSRKELETTGSTGNGRDFQATTAADGTFALHFRGELLMIEQIVRPPYQSRAYPDKVYNWAYREDLPAPPTSDPGNPVVFQMWKPVAANDPLPRLWDVSIGGPCITIQNFDKTYSAYLTKSRKDPMYACIVEGKEDDADLWIKAWRSPWKPAKNSPHKKVCDWSYELEVPHGGLAKLDTPNPFWAPETGYERQFSFHANTDEPGWEFASKHLFFIRARNGKLYGSLDVHVDNFVEGVNIGLAGFVNPNGSRNLQPGGEFLNR